MFLLALSKPHSMAEGLFVFIRVPLAILRLASTSQGFTRMNTNVRG